MRAAATASGSSAFLPAQTTTPGAPRRRRQMDQPQPLGIRWRGGGIDQKHHRRFQPLGAVHGHDANLVARNLHVALDFKVGRAQPGHEALQRGRRLALIAQREFEEFVERVVGLLPEPPQDAFPAAIAAEQPGIERKRRLAAKRVLARVQAGQRGR